MPKVFLRNSTYDYGILRPLMFGIMDSIIGGRIRQDSRVLIKPNLLAPASPDRAIVTHPLIIKAAAEYVFTKGVRPRISDSPGIGSFEKILEESGIKGALKGLDVEYKEFGRYLKVDTGEPFGKIEIAEDALDADIVINLPKLKTHAQMLLTLGVKNLFGCIVGMKKPEWHLRTGIDREMFAKLLVRVYKAVDPSITIIDGILAMEGQGPGRRGMPRNLGIIMGSSDAIAIDVMVCRMLGINQNDLYTNRAAGELGLLSSEITLEGYMPEIRNFKLPGISPLIFGPGKLHGFMRRHLVQRPVWDKSLCKMCGECSKYCPAKAIAKEEERLGFDYDRCIRCYCCIEICPHAALHAEETSTGKILRKALKIK